MRENNHVKFKGEYESTYLSWYNRDSIKKYQKALKMRRRSESISIFRSICTCNNQGLCPACKMINLTYLFAHYKALPANSEKLPYYLD